jgi:hypothetical protein
MGDFNDNPTNRSIKKVLLAVGNTSKFAENALFNTSYSTFKKGYGTGVYNGAWNLFDQIIISKNMLGEQKNKLSYFQNSFTIFAPKWMQIQSGPSKGGPYRNFSRGQYQNGYSDHYPVLIQLKL